MISIVLGPEIKFIEIFNSSFSYYTTLFGFKFVNSFVSRTK